MPRVVMDLNTPTLKVATSELGLATGVAVECQVTSAAVSSVPKLTTIPATGCAGESQKAAPSGWQLDLAWLQDWTVPDPGGLSKFAYDNDGKQVWFELIPAAGDTATGCTGSAWCSAGAFGGTFGDGSAPVATATWPCVEKPTIDTPGP